MAYFSIEFHSGGILRKRFECPANAVRGLMAVPDFEGICRAMPPKYWPAIQRENWWQRDDAGGPQMPLRLDMSDRRGKPLGTLFATENKP